MSYHDLHVLHSKKRHDLLLSPIPFWNDSFNDYKWSVPNRKNVSILSMIQLFIDGNREILKGQINLVRASFSFKGGKKFIVLLTLMFNLFILCTQLSFSSQGFIAGVFTDLSSKWSTSNLEACEIICMFEMLKLRLFIMKLF